jgi:D-glycero-D-manno-heptose 1,7-bisphosphate phosphatase
MARRLDAVFFDRDGVLIEDHHYLADPEGVLLIPGARSLTKRLSEAGVLQFIVTNQSGVARGLFPIEAVDKVHQRLFADLGGNPFSGVAVCPHHPQGSVATYALACDCRKPAPGMVLGFLRQFALDPAACCLVGDKESDVIAATAAGMRGFRFEGGNLDEWFTRAVLIDGGYALAV